MVEEFTLTDGVLCVVSVTPMTSIMGTRKTTGKRSNFVQSLACVRAPSRLLQYTLEITHCIQNVGL